MSLSETRTTSTFYELLIWLNEPQKWKISVEFADGYLMNFSFLCMETHHPRYKVQSGWWHQVEQEQTKISYLTSWKLFKKHYKGDLLPEVKNYLYSTPVKTKKKHRKKKIPFTISAKSFLKDTQHCCRDFQSDNGLLMECLI